MIENKSQPNRANKTCSKCGIEKSADSFYFQRLRCKDCYLDNNRKNMHGNKNISDTAKEYYRKHKEESAENVRKYIEKYPEKNKARIEYRKALYHGVITKKPCEQCGEANVEGHHEDYTKPLEVIWLCHKHHMERHRKYPNPNL